MRTTLKKIMAFFLALLLCSFAPMAFAEDVEAGYQIRISMANADRAYCARQGLEGQLKQEGGCSIWRPDSWVEFDLDIPAAGDWRIGIKLGCDPGFSFSHDISIDGTTVFETEEGVPATGSFTAREDLVIATVTFETAGEHTVLIKCTGGTACYSEDMFLTFLGEPIELTSVTASTADIMAGDSVSAGTDAIVAEFTTSISETDLTDDLSGKVSLTDSNGNSIKLIGKVSGNTLTACLAETLKADETYTLKLINVKDAIDYSSVEGANFTFTTVEGEGVAEIADAQASVTGENVTIEAVMLSSEAVGINGRNYSIYLSYEDEEKGEEPVLTGVSGDDGVISTEYIIPAGSPDGTYKLHIGGEYVTDETVISVIYVTAETKASIENALAASQTADEVETVLTDATNASYIGINPASEIGTLRKADVYTHFLGKDIDFDNIAAEFRKYIAVETFRQANTAIKMRRVLNEELNWVNMGLDKGKYDLIANPGTLVTALVQSAGITDADEYIANLSDLVNEALLVTYGKTDLTPAFSDISAYVNQGAYVPLAFNEDVSELYGIEFILTVSDADMLSVSDIVIKVPGDGSAWGGDNVVSGTIFFDYPINANDLGNISIQVPASTGTYTAKLSGTAIYAPSGIDYLLYADIIETEMQITATKKPSSTPVVESQRPSASGSSRPSGGGSGGGSVVIPPSTDGEETVKTETFSFSDVSKEHWAFEAVDYLVKNSIIEESADGKYNPDEKMAREEIVKMMVIALGLTDESAVSNLSDVTKSNPYYKYIASAEKYGIIMGNDLGQFMIGQSVTREDICVILHRAVEKVYSFKGSDTFFTDDSMISGYAKTAVYNMKGAGIIEGVGANEFMPKGDVTRAQAAKMIYEIVKAVGR